MEGKKTWSTAGELRLIELVREIPVLWNSNLDDYKLVEPKALKWLTIADELKTTSGLCPACNLYCLLITKIPRSYICFLK